MSEYIDRDALKDKARELIPNYHASVVMNLFDLIDNLADNMPTVDAEPVRHGRWQEEIGMIMCSECGDAWAMAQEEEVRSFNYCPNCGARMDGGQE